MQVIVTGLHIIMYVHYALSIQMGCHCQVHYFCVLPPWIIFFACSCFKWHLLLLWIPFLFIPSFFSFPQIGCFCLIPPLFFILMTFQTPWYFPFVHWALSQIQWNKCIEEMWRLCIYGVLVLEQCLFCRPKARAFTQ